MDSKKIENLFLRQSYIDAWSDYKASLTKKSLKKWDYIILTASNNEQAKTYMSQIQIRLEKGLLPKEIHYAVIPDPEGKRVGSGGATLNVLKYVKDDSVTGDPFKNKRILVIHSGGDSKRVPQYSACGKLFSPVPRELPDGRHSTLFDEFIIAMSGVPSRIKDGMLVLAGDVLLLFNPLQIDFQLDGAAAISIKEHVNIGKNHGVFLADNKMNVKRFLHKQSIESLKNHGAVDNSEMVNIDTGAVLMDSTILNDLYSLISTDDKFNEFVNEKSRISFYGDFLYPLAEKSTLDEYYLEAPEGEFTEELKECRTKIWNVLRKHRLKMLSLSPAQFIHFGTTGELLNLLTEEIEQYTFLDWNKKAIYNKDNTSNFACINSYVDTKSSVGEKSYIENSYILGECNIGNNCVISNVRLENQTIEDGTVLHGLKLKNGKYVVRKYNIDTNPKVNDFWNEKLFYESDTIEDAVNACDGNKTSLCESFNNADTDFIIKWHDEIESTIRVKNFINAVQNRVFVDEALKEFGNAGIGKSELTKLLKYADNASFSDKIRIYYYLSKTDKISDSVVTSELLENKCFSTIRNAILDENIKGVSYNDKFLIKKDYVKIDLPVRVNWGGGWSDTPPYCNENGGCVINAAIKLNGINPIVVEVKKLDDYVIEFESTDAGNHGIYTDINDIVNCSNPFDMFALHKAALIACGVVPADGSISLEDILRKIGGGIYLSTCVVDVPRGSGLGTSSILSGACVKAILEFFDVNYTLDELYDRALCMEQIMSTGGGWQDQVGGLTNGIKMLTTKKGLAQKIKIENVELSEETLKELSERFALIYTGQRRLARNLLREVVGKYISSSPSINDVMHNIQKHAVLMKFELEKGNIDEFAKLLTSHWELSKKLDSGCTNTCIDQIFMAIDDMIDGKFISGAGGGGFLQVIIKKEYTRDMVQERLRSVFKDSGIKIWDTTFV